MGRREKFFRLKDCIRLLLILFLVKGYIWAGSSTKIGQGVVFSFLDNERLLFFKYSGNLLQSINIYNLRKKEIKEGIAYLPKECAPLDTRALIPSLSPGGKVIAFAGPPMEESSQKGFRVLLLDIASEKIKELRQVKDTLSSMDRISWSPDGKAITYTARKPGCFYRGIVYRLKNPNMPPSEDNPYIEEETNLPREGIWIAYLGENREEQLTIDADSDDFAPIFTPHGEAVLYTSVKGKYVNICIVDLKTKRANYLTTDNDSFFPYPSPDGKQIVYYRKKGDGELWLIDMNKNERMPLVDKLPVYPMLPFLWHPSGEGVFFVAKNRNKWLIAFVEVSTGNIEEILSSEDPIISYSISPDGKWLAYSVSSKEERGEEAFSYITSFSRGK
jgi:Tol biopolymer transport system component